MSTYEVVGQIAEVLVKMSALGKEALEPLTELFIIVLNILIGTLQFIIHILS